MHFHIILKQMFYFNMHLDFTSKQIYCIKMHLNTIIK